MKSKFILIAWLSLLAIRCIGSAQSVTPGQIQTFDKRTRPVPARPTEETIIRGLMRDPDAFYRGVGAVQLHRMGDLAATALIKIIGAKDISENETIQVLDILHRAYEHIGSVKPEYRNPNSSLFLLRSLSTRSQPSTISAKIEDTRNFITGVSAPNPAN